MREKEKKKDPGQFGQVDLFWTLSAIFIPINVHSTIYCTLHTSEGLASVKIHIIKINKKNVAYRLQITQL